jgi:ribosome-binding protein aMBF1 (putative translation factor)
LVRGGPPSDFLDAAGKIERRHRDVIELTLQNVATGVQRLAACPDGAYWARRQGTAASVVVDRLAKGAQQIRVWRGYRGLSLRALAEKAGISAAMLSEIEHAKKEGSVRTLSALAGALGLDLDDLVPRN